MTLFAQPYNQAAKGFYFENLDEFIEKVSNVFDDCQNKVEEFELMFIDGEDAELFKACGIGQDNIETWFNDIGTLDDREKVALFFLVDCLNYKLEDALKKLDDVIIYEGPVLDAATELFDECYVSEIPEFQRRYIDYKAFAHDCEVSGDMTEFEYQNITYTCTNTSCL